MSIYKPFNENWFYSEFQIENLKDIQEEFVKFAKTFNQREIVFTPKKKEQFQEQVPVFVQFLKDMDLYHRWHATAFALVPPNQSYPPHIDSIDASFRSQALNIPIENYENTYTVWYDAKILGSIWGNLWGHVDKTLNTSVMCDAKSAKERCRVTATKPMIINVTLPHAVINPTDKVRFLVSTRFNPELDEADLLRLGIKQPYIQI